MQCIYRLKEDSIIDEEGQKRNTYGIEALDNCGNQLKSVSDIFLDRKKAEDFINLCNEKKLSLIHLMDIIEDAIT